MSSDLVLDESQQALRDLAADLFAKRVDPSTIEKVESTGDRFDRDLWSGLADAGLLGVAVPEGDGGLGFGALELALVLEQLGRVVAPVPLGTCALAAWCVATHGDDAVRRDWLTRLVDGSAVMVVAPPPSLTSVRHDGDKLSGVAVGVPWAHVADAILLPTEDGVVLVDPAGPGVVSQREETTAREGGLTLTFDGTPVTRVGGADAATWLRLRWRVVLAAVQAGVTDAAVRLAAAYTSEREQFGKPLSTFQGVALKAADAYLDAVAIRAVALQAAWAVELQEDPTLEVLTAAWWAAEAGQHCVHLTQHLHGGMGADVTYPVHRYFLWGKQIELMLGGAPALLAELGDALTDRPAAGDALVLD